ncbi:septum site-determining protein MinC [Thermosyntropha lipolytica DSM 11003]|uniref:Probable septum site-determining protein MinC n=1 Tax=Thermosyntropha lipolytica DSM 11003 TaxID=1123382 RepID=A0A1M5N4X5_9FIRM|nr:septum site-determining protein MinC [Thermosyntropha lipolytica]SHG84043.1 septum site-determining protein MinC [Thermosyntropha lipolytica DSM 11003]
MISIKGINGNLVFNFLPGNFEDYIRFLTQKFSSNPRLFAGSKVVFRGEGLNFLSHEEIAALQKLCLDYGMVLNNNPSSLEKGAGQDVIIYRNIRSGQKIFSEGSVIVWGNVHESAEIIAARDIIILGKLEGIVHAGFYGDKNSIVFALQMAPGQIRIADKFSRAPADYTPKDYPEIAYLEEDTICIKRYVPQENLARLNS